MPRISPIASIFTVWLEFIAYYLCIRICSTNFWSLCQIYKANYEKSKRTPLHFRFNLCPYYDPCRWKTTKELCCLHTFQWYLYVYSSFKTEILLLEIKAAVYAPTGRCDHGIVGIVICHNIFIYIVANDDTDNSMTTPSCWSVSGRFDSK